MRLLRDIDEKLFVELLEQIFQLLPTRIDHLLLLWKKSTMRLEILKKASITPQSISLFTCCLWMACCIWAGETWASWDCKILWRFCSAWGIWTDWLDPAPAGALTPAADPSPASCIALQIHRYAQSLNFFTLCFFTFSIFLQQTDLREHQLLSKVIPLLKRLPAIPTLFLQSK